MATFTASFVRVCLSARAEDTTIMPVADLSSAVRLTNLTTSGTSAVVQSGGGDWEAPYNGILRVVCDGPVNIVAAVSPTAAATAGVYVPAGHVDHFTVNAGHKLAVIDA